MRLNKIWYQKTSYAVRGTIKPHKNNLWSLKKNVSLMSMYVPASIVLKMDSSTSTVPLSWAWALPLCLPFLLPDPCSSAQANLALDSSSKLGLRSGGWYGKFARMLGSAKSSWSRKNMDACRNAISADADISLSMQSSSLLPRKSLGCVGILRTERTWWNALMPRSTHTTAGLETREWTLDCQLRSPTSNGVSSLAWKAVSEGRNLMPMSSRPSPESVRGVDRMLVDVCLCVKTKINKSDVGIIQHFHLFLTLYVPHLPRTSLQTFTKFYCASFQVTQYISKLANLLCCCCIFFFCFPVICQNAKYKCRTIFKTGVTTLNDGYFEK